MSTIQRYCAAIGKKFSVAGQASVLASLDRPAVASIWTAIACGAPEQRAVWFCAVAEALYIAQLQYQAQGIVHCFVRTGASTVSYARRERVTGSFRPNRTLP